MTDPIDAAKHAGDCTIYSAMGNDEPWDGICTCGGGWREVRKGDGDHYRHMLSPARYEAMIKQHEAYQ
jgi:hypothetical protein